MHAISCILVGVVVDQVGVAELQVGKVTGFCPIKERPSMPSSLMQLHKYTRWYAEHLQVLLSWILLHCMTASTELVLYFVCVCSSTGASIQDDASATLASCRS